MRNALQIFGNVFWVALLGFAAIQYVVDASGPKINRVHETYEIAGLGSAALRREMSMKGPVSDGNGARYWAWADWNVAWRYSYEASGFGCHITHVDVTVDVKVTTPRWRNMDAASGHMRAAWSRMYSALERHEERHASHGIAAGHEIHTALSDMEPRPTCDTLEKDANALGHRIVDKYSAKDVEYDRQTKHGFTEGVRLP